MIKHLTEVQIHTSEQAILAMLDTDGPQDFATLLLECHIQATDGPTEKTVRTLFVGMLDAGTLFSDGILYSTNRQDFEPTNLIHCFDFLSNAFD